MNRKLVKPVPEPCKKTDTFLLVLYHNFNLKYIKVRDDSTTMIANKKTRHYCGQLQDTNNKDTFCILR